MAKNKPTVPYKWQWTDPGLLTNPSTTKFTKIKSTGNLVIILAFGVSRKFICHLSALF